MTEDDFDDFVRVRWGDLEPAARLVVLDPVVARDVTAAALTRLRAEWRSASAEGRPVERARRLVVTAALARAAGTGRRLDRRRSPAPAGDDTAPSAPGHDPDHDLDGEPDPVVAALVEHVRRLEPLDRAVLVGRELWDATPEEVAHVLERPAGELVERRDRLDEGLAATHATVVDADGEPPHAWTLDRDVGAAVDVLLRDLGDPPDPADLVERRARRVRRRTLVLAAAGVATLGGAGAALALRRAPAPVAAAPLPAPNDRSWLLAETWATRGPLASDPLLRTFRSRRIEARDRILWAGDVGTRRLVVVLTRSVEQFPDQPGLRVFTGAKGSDLLGLDLLPLPFGLVTEADTVALSVPDSPETRAARSILLLLARPTVTTSSYSLVVRPTAQGTVRRRWTEVALSGGAAAVSIEGPSTLAMRVRLGRSESRPIGSELAFARYEGIYGSGPLSTEIVEEFISEATGIPVPWLRTEERVDALREHGLFEAPDTSGTAPPGTCTTLSTWTPDGALLRTTTYHDDRTGTMLMQLAQVVAVKDANAPWLTMATELKPGQMRFLVVHPPAATVQVIGAGGDAGPSSERVPTGGRGATVVTLGHIGEYGEFRVVLRDRRGRITYDAVPNPGTWMVDA